LTGSVRDFLSTEIMVTENKVFSSYVWGADKNLQSKL